MNSIFEQAIDSWKENDYIRTAFIDKLIRISKSYYLTTHSKHMGKRTARHEKQTQIHDGPIRRFTRRLIIPDANFEQIEMYYILHCLQLITHRVDVPSALEPNLEIVNSIICHLHELRAPLLLGGSLFANSTCGNSISWWLYYRQTANAPTIDRRQTRWEMIVYLQRADRETEADVRRRNDRLLTIVRSRSRRKSRNGQTANE